MKAITLLENPNLIPAHERLLHQVYNDVPGFQSRRRNEAVGRLLERVYGPSTTTGSRQWTFVHSMRVSPTEKQRARDAREKARDGEGADHVEEVEEDLSWAQGGEDDAARLEGKASRKRKVRLFGRNVLRSEASVYGCSRHSFSRLPLPRVS